MTIDKGSEFADSLTRIRLPRGEWHFDPSRRLGAAGGFGEVFEGVDGLHQPVAVKRLRVSVGEAAHRELTIADDLAGRRFTHVMEVLDAGEDAEGGGYFVVMPRAKGSLADEIRRRGALPSAEAVKILCQIAQGLEEVSHIVHRDLKPDNVLFHDESWKVADFGIARFVEVATSPNTLRDCLTEEYASPEQWTGERATAATDVYALCCIAYALLQGRPPFNGPDLRRQHLGETPPVLTDIDPRLRAILSAGLRKPPAGRPATARLIAVFHDMSLNVEARAPAIRALQAVNAAEAERASIVAAETERSRQQAAQRNALIESGKRTLQEMIKTIEEAARVNAPESVINSSQTGPLSVRIGRAELRVELEGAVPPNAMFPSCKWEVLAIGRIDVSQTMPNAWEHGATLWYMRRQREDDYRWHEVSYKRSGFTRGPLVGPFAIQRLGNDIYTQADLAAGPGLHVIQLEFGPIAIDDEDLEAFVERWLARLVQAYHGRLRPF